jgi:hypothetical protein
MKIATGLSISVDALRREVCYSRVPTLEQEAPLPKSGTFTIVLLATVSIASGCSSGVKLERSEARHRGQLIFNGYESSKIDCYYCHNGNGRGAKMYCYNCHSGEGEETGVVPDLAPKVTSMSDAELIEAIEDGPAFMPGFRKKLSKEQIKHLLCWFRLAFGGP